MAAESSWSLRGVDPRAREIARTAAKREGITIGEWLNRQLLEDGEDNSDAPGGSFDDPEALAHLLDRLSRRIEAAEHRSTLAITGIDQSVLGVISRLQSAEELQSEFSQRYNKALGELRQTQSALQQRIAKLEREGGDAGLEALKSLEEALSKLANQVYDSETDTRARLDALKGDIERASKRSGERIETVSRALDERLADVERKVETDLGAVSDTVAREVEAAARRIGRDSAVAAAKADKDIAGLQEGLASTRSEVQTARSDLEATRSDVAEVRDQISGAKSDLDAVRSDVDANKGAIEATRADVDAARETFSGDLHSVREELEQSRKDVLSRDDVDRVRSELEAVIADRAEAGREQIESLEAALGHVNARLGSAERVTDRAIKALEQSFSELDARVRGAEERLDALGDPADRDAFAEELEARFADLSRELADSVSSTRAELAAKVAEIAQDDDKSALRARLDEMTTQVADAERRQRQTLERISAEVAKLAGAVEARVRRSEETAAGGISEARAAANAAQTTAKGAADAARNAADKIEARLAEADKVAEELADLHARVADAEAASAAAVDEVNRRVQVIADAQSSALTEEDLQSRIRDSEQRTREMVDGVVADMRRQVADVTHASGEALSPIQSALETLRERLAAIEAGGGALARREEADPIFDASFEEDDLDVLDDTTDAAAGDAAETPLETVVDDEDSFDIELEIAEDAPVKETRDAAADLAGGFEAEDEAVSDFVPEFDDVADDFGLAEEFEAEREDADALASSSGFDQAFESAEFAFTDSDLDELGPEDAAFDLVFGRSEEDGPEAGTRGRGENFLRTARDAARKGAKTDEPLEAGFGPVEGEAAVKTKKGRSLLAAAGGLAVLAVGAAGYVALRDGADAGGAGEAPDDPLNDVLGSSGGVDSATGYVAVEPPAITPSASPFGEGAIPVDLNAAVGSDFSLFAEGGALFAPIEPETPTSTDELQGLLDRAIAYAPDAPSAPPVAPAPADAGASAGETPADDAPVETPTEPASDDAAAAVEPPAAPAETAAAEDAAAEPLEDADATDGAVEAQAQPEIDAAVQAATVTVQDAAEAGDPVAQFEYGGALIDRGELAEGVRLMRQAAENGLAAAQYRLSKLHETGRGVELDLAEARRWTERAANAGHVKAMHNLGIFYAEGRGAPQDFDEAGRWFEEAALFGSTDSQFNLAVLYEQGLGVQQSLPDAYAWFSIAARAGDEDAAARAEAVTERIAPQARERADEAVRRFSARPLDEEVNGVFRDTPWSAAAIDARTSIARAQAALAALGFEPGPADGVMGGMTRSAIEAYQAANGLEPTGRVDASLVEKLEADVSALE